MAQVVHDTKHGLQPTADQQLVKQLVGSGQPQTETPGGLRSAIIHQRYNVYSSTTAGQQQHALQRRFHSVDCSGPTGPLHSQS